MKKLVFVLGLLCFEFSALADSCGTVKTIMKEASTSEGVYRFYFDDGNSTGVVADPLFLDLIKESWKSKFKICVSKHSFGNSELVFSVERPK